MINVLMLLSSALGAVCLFIWFLTNEVSDSYEIYSVSFNGEKTPERDILPSGKFTPRGNISSLSYKGFYFKTVLHYSNCVEAHITVHASI